MSSIVRRFSALFVFTLILSACSVLPGVTVAPGSSETTPLALPTLGQASAGAGVASTPTAPMPTAASPSTQMPSAQPAPTNPPVVEPQPVVSQPTFQPPTTTPLADLNDFSTQLAAALEARDLSTLRSLMGDQFAFAAWNASLTVIDSDDAIQNLSQDRLAPGAQPVVRFGTDLVQLLSGTDPLSLWGPVDQVVRAFHVMGLGPLAADEAVVVIGRSPATGR
ncbi:MAG TPA: hypothetical protein VHO48_10120, partial [Anaerolineaceae bacterium]|nr:hypothetical protein [Anaerolineaceae bacterium]